MYLWCKLMLPYVSVFKTFFRCRTALDVENILREKDVVPATIAIINGTIHVGKENRLGFHSFSLQYQLDIEWLKFLITVI